MEEPTHLRPIVLGGHFGDAIDIFSSGFHFTMQYGFFDDSKGRIKKPKTLLSNIGKEDMIRIATLLLALVEADS